MPPPSTWLPKNVVVSGAGCSTLYYLGAYLAIRDAYRGRTLPRSAACVSGGNILGLLLAFQPSDDELLAMRPFVARFVKSWRDAVNMGLGAKLVRFVRRMGFSDVQPMMRDLRTMVGMLRREGPVEGPYTFAQLHRETGMQLSVLATRFRDCQSETFSTTNSPDLCIFEAISASISVPVMFSPVKIDSEWYLDGCMGNNFPLSSYDPCPGNPSRYTFGIGVYTTLPVHMDYRMQLPLYGWNMLRAMYQFVFTCVYRQVMFSATPFTMIHTRHCAVYDGPPFPIDAEDYRREAVDQTMVCYDKVISQLSIPCSRSRRRRQAAMRIVASIYSLESDDPQDLLST